MVPEAPLTDSIVERNRMVSTEPLKSKRVSTWQALAGVGGIGTGMFFALEGNHTLGRNESRPGRLLDIRDYCKLHIISHYVAVLLGADPSGDPFLVLPIGKVGNDVIGRRLIAEMDSAGMDTRFVQPTEELPTLLSICFQYPDGSGGNITTSESAASALTPGDVDRAVDSVASRGVRFLALAAPEVPLEIRHYFLQRAKTCGAFRAASFTTAEIHGAFETGILQMADLVAMNEDEAQTLAGMELDVRNPLCFLQRCKEMLSSPGHDTRVVVTAGKAGAFAIQSGCWDYCPAPEVSAVSTAGAGDALMAGLLAGLATGLPFIAAGPPRSDIADRPLTSAFELAVLLAACSVTSPHTIHPSVSAASLIEFARDRGVTLGAVLQRVLGVT
jgi:sugar/nucleoside kinase (ribokinase family)